MIWKAHINENSKEIQTVKEHSENTASLCRDFSIPALKDILYMTGLLHDIGKYQVSFQERINGKNIKVEHSGCGAKEVQKKYPSIVKWLMSYCITGHHSGIPDGGFKNDTKDQATLHGRLEREFEDYSIYKEELKGIDIDEKAFCEFLAEDCGNNMDMVIDKFAFLVRYCFSCLTDADSIDTATFCTGKTNRSLNADFKNCLDKVNKYMDSFSCVSGLQKTRAVLQEQVFSQVGQDAGIYLMNMPTGSGKTLCSIKFALQRAINMGKQRIIYIIPYNSIIEQTADVFEKVFGEDAEILRHQSTFSYDEESGYSEDYQEVVKYATENWDARIIITTAVQFFETIYSNKRSKLRKMHNMADSILVFDEAHLMPVKYLKPCLEAVSYITKYLNSEAVLLTATMPDYEKLVNEYAVPGNKVCNLIYDTSMFSMFNKCKYEHTGALSEEALLNKSAIYPSSLIVVNKRSSARALYKLCRGKKFHLSTYMTAYDRSVVISDIKSELKKLEEDYPGFENVPEDRRITVISTSLIEAGVDLDFYTVFREMAGLDNILQAGGRCNREGKRKDASVFIFTLETEDKSISNDERPNITKGLVVKYKDISCKESIDEYYNLLYFFNKDEIIKRTISRKCKTLESIPFKDYAEEFHMIDTNTISIVVARDEKSGDMIEQLKITKKGNPRKLQKYALSVYKYEFDDLLKQGAVDDYGSGIYCLANTDYYEKETGIKFEAEDYIF